MNADLPRHGEKIDSKAWAAIDVLIGRIYECALDPALWDDTLAQLTGTLSPLEWDVAFLIWESHQPPTARFVGATGLAAGIPEIYSAAYAADNPWSRRIAPLRTGSLIDTDDLIRRDEFTASPLYRDFLVRWGLDRALAIVLDRRDGERLALVMPGPGERDVELLKRGLRVLGPHIQRAVRISHRIADAELRAGAADAATDAAGSAVLCLRTDLSIVTANRQVTAHIDNGVISTSGGRLRYRDLASQRALLALAASQPPAGCAFASAGDDGAVVGSVAARVPTQTARVLGGHVEGAGIILAIGGGAEPRAIEISRIAAWFGLTPAEARLASALAGGQPLADYCAIRGVSINAGRFLLKGVFRKTEVASQAQLAALLGRMPA